jgi:mono/diheme cytochrome c family protein
MSMEVSHKTQAGIMNKAMLISALIPGIFLLSSFMPDPQLDESIKRGKEAYVLYCQNCHLEDGQGMPETNPPLAKADYIKKPAKTLIGIILKGQSDEVVVNGKKYNAIMPAQEYLTDDQIADVLNYVRNSWGNKIPGAITPAMVKGLRN